MLATKKGVPLTDASLQKPEKADELDKMLAELTENEGKSIVVCGDNNPDYQVLVNGINQMLGNIGNTIRFERTYNHFTGSEQWKETLLATDPGAVIIWDINPIYNHPESERCV